MAPHVKHWTSISVDAMPNVWLFGALIEHYQCSLVTVHVHFYNVIALKVCNRTVLNMHVTWEQKVLHLYGFPHPPCDPLQVLMTPKLKPSWILPINLALHECLPFVEWSRTHYVVPTVCTKGLTSASLAVWGFRFSGNSIWKWVCSTSSLALLNGEFEAVNSRGYSWQ